MEIKDKTVIIVIGNKTKIAEKINPKADGLQRPMNQINPLKKEKNWSKNYSIRIEKGNTMTPRYRRD